MVEVECKVTCHLTPARCRLCQGRWERGRYSLLAGFVEVGETFEMAVGREVGEEAGVEVDHTSVR